MFRNKITYLLIAFVSIIIISFAGNTYNNILKEKSIKAVHNELVSIANLKIDNISDWYTDELEDARIISQNRFLIAQIEQWYDDQSIIDSMFLKENIESIKKEHSYVDVWILFNKSALLDQHFGFDQIVPHQVRKTAELALKTNSVLSTDLYRDENDGEIYLDFISPLNDNMGHTIGVIVFRMDPNQFLYPLIQNWPVPSESAETAIFRKSNDSITYLNELRHAQHTALKLSISLDRTDVSAVQGALGFDGIVDGLDYRDVEVISYVSDIHDTPWFMVAEVDKAELYDGITDQTRLFNLLLVLLLFLVLTLLGFIYSNSQKNVFKTLWLAQEEFKTTLYSIGDAVITTDKQGAITHLNPIAEQLTGWKEEEALGLPVDEVFYIISEITAQKVESPVTKVLREGKIVGLANHTLLVSKNGAQIPIADSGAPILDDQNNISGIVLVFRDQTEEREHRKIVDEQRRRLFTLMSNLPGMAYRCKNDKYWTMEFVSKGCFPLFGYNDFELEQNKKIAYGDLIIPEDREYVNREVEKALQSNVSFEFEYRIKDRSGNLKWVWEKGQGVTSENNEVVAIEGFIRDVTILKKNQADLVKSEKLFQTLAKNAGVGIFKTDEKGLTTYINPKYCELVGLTAEEALGLGWLKYLHPEDRKTIEENWLNALNNQSERLDEYRFIHPNGKIIWVKGQVTPEITNNGELMGFVGTITDITDQVNAEETIKQQIKLFDTVIENIPDAVYMKDINGNKIIANKADIANCGALTKEEVLGKNDFDVFPKEIAEGFWHDDLRVLKHGEVIIDRLEKLQNRNGETKWLYTSKIPFKDEKGKILGLVGIGHDITRRKSDEEERIKLSTVVEQTPLSIIITDKDGTIEYINPKFTEVTGYSYEEAIGQNPRMLKSGTQDDYFYQKMWNELTNGRVWSSEFQNKKKNGELYWEFVFITPIVNSNGEIMKYAAVREDITEKRRIQEKLVAAMLKAEESDRLKTSFLANMSHEIRTPLNSILGFTNILEESDDLTPDERSVYSTIIRKSSDSLLQIINDIIDISSLETGQMKISNSQFDVNQLISMLHQEFIQRAVELGKNEIEIRKTDFDDTILITSDKNRINQIFINLLTNAMKFTDKGVIEFGVVEQDEKNIYFKVQDTGFGIEEEMRDIIFERFRQGEEKNTRNFGGNGLGLSIVKNLIELMGGKIWLDSEVGIGSSFNFYLPKSI